MEINVASIIVILLGKWILVSMLPPGPEAQLLDILN